MQNDLTASTAKFPDLNRQGTCDQSASSKSQKQRKVLGEKSANHVEGKNFNIFDEKENQISHEEFLRDKFDEQTDFSNKYDGIRDKYNEIHSIKEEQDEEVLGFRNTPTFTDDFFNSFKKIKTTDELEKNELFSNDFKSFNCEIFNNSINEENKFDNQKIEENNKPQEFSFIDLIDNKKMNEFLNSKEFIPEEEAQQPKNKTFEDLQKDLDALKEVHSRMFAVKSKIYQAVEKEIARFKHELRLEKNREMEEYTALIDQKDEEIEKYKEMIDDKELLNQKMNDLRIQNETLKNEALKYKTVYCKLKQWVKSQKDLR